MSFYEVEWISICNIMWRRPSCQCWSNAFLSILLCNPNQVYLMNKLEKDQRNCLHFYDYKSKLFNKSTDEIQNFAV